MYARSLELTAALVAFTVALGVTPAVRFAALRVGMLDVPGRRSLHTRATPRGGGLALVAALMAALVVAPPTPWRPDVVALLAGGGVLALLGLADDWRSRPAAWRLVIQGLAAAGFVAFAGGLDRAPLPSPLDVTLGRFGGMATVLWIVAVVNFYNFLDGIDGLAAVQGVVTGLGIALAGWDEGAALVAAALAGACAAFLLFNWSPARIFLGDVGSLLLGFAFAALPLLAAPAQRPRAVFFVAASLWLFLADATFTLLWRSARGARWDEGHRDHLYQRLVAAGWTHRAITLAVGAGGALLTGAALLGWRAGAPLETATVLVAMGLFALEWRTVRACERRHSGRAVTA